MCSLRTIQMTRRARQYPPDIVSLASQLYLGGATISEVQAELPRGYKAQVIIERYVPVRRRSGHRDQSGTKNAAWRGDDLSYTAAHYRVTQRRGRASRHACLDCSAPAQEWSYIGGCPREKRDPLRGSPYSPNPEMYVPRCKSCHTKLDRKRASDGRFLGHEPRQEGAA